MKRFEIHIWRWVGVLVVAGMMVGCNLPARETGGSATQAVTVVASSVPVLMATAGGGAATALPAATADAPTAAATAEPSAAAVLPGATATTSPSAALDRKDPNALIAALVKALEQKDSRFFEQMLAEHLSYVNYIEGGQPMEPAQVVSDVKARLADSSPTCTQYGTYGHTLQIWTSGWTPDWQIDKLCYQDCNPVTPPFKSRTAGFFFNPRTDDSYELSVVWLNDDSLWRSVYQVQMHACSEPYQAPAAALVCPGAPTTRLNVNGFATVSTDTVTANRARSAAGTSAPIVGLLPPGQVVQIVDGPTCLDGYVWWKVKAQTLDLTGWTAEGQGKEYWLVPCSGGDGCKK